jgi:hypothetical protein
VNNIIEILAGIVARNSKKLQKGVSKENSIEIHSNLGQCHRVH